MNDTDELHAKLTARFPESFGRDEAPRRGTRIGVSRRPAGSMSVVSGRGCFDFLHALTATDHPKKLLRVFPTSTATPGPYFGRKAELPRCRRRIAIRTPVLAFAEGWSASPSTFEGVVFEGHPDLRRCCCRTDWDRAPRCAQDYVEGRRLRDLSNHGTTRSNHYLAGSPVRADGQRDHSTLRLNRWRLDQLLYPQSSAPARRRR